MNTKLTCDIQICAVCTNTSTGSADSHSKEANVIIITLKKTLL